MAIALRETSGHRKKHGGGSLCQGSSGLPAVKKSAIENNRHVTFFSLRNLDSARTVGRLSTPKCQ